MGFKTTFTRLRGPVTQRIRTDTSSVIIEGTLLIDSNLEITGTINGVDVEALSAKTAFTSSVGGVSIYNVATPRFVLTGSISSGSVASITCSMVPNSHFQCMSRAIIRDTSISRSIYTKALSTHVTWFSGSSPVIDFQNAIDDNFYSIPAGLSASISGDSLIFTLTSSTGSNYSYTILGDGSTITF